MDLGAEALGSFKAKQGGCTQIQASPCVHAIECQLKLPAMSSSSTKRQDISSKRFFFQIVLGKLTQ